MTRVPESDVRIREEYSPEEPEWTPESYRAHLAVGLEEFYGAEEAELKAIVERTKP